MKYKKLLSIKGGYISNPFKQIEVFLSLIIIGYFGVKIVYGIFFNFYPQKYYYRNIEINSTSSSTEEYSENTYENSAENTNKLVLNAYMPGMWNNEITDFTITIILSLIIFVYTSMQNRNMISEEGTLNPALVFGFLIGCGYPPIKHNLDPLFKNNLSESFWKKVFNCGGILLFLLVVIFIIVSNYSSMNNNSNSSVGYLTYVCTIILFLFGLFYSRKVSTTTEKITYNMSEGSNCSTSSNKFVKSSGERLKISTTFIVFILLLLFSYSPTNPTLNYGYTFIYGVLLGIFISGISYYGIEYFLIKQPEKICNSYAECNSNSNVISLTEDEDEDSEDYENNIIEEKIYDNNSVSIIKLMLVIFLLIILVYLGYNFISK